jgi:putative dimethyl sulfoxide reductase chaperone
MLNELLLDAPKVSRGVTGGNPRGGTALVVALVSAVAELKARADIYRLLAGVFVEEASPGFLDALRQPEMLRQLADAGLRFDADFTEAPAAELIDKLAIEYTTLFVASGGMPPVESVRLYGRFKQEPNFETMQTYRRCGFVLQPGRHEVFSDQLGVELMFVAELLDRSAAALEGGDTDAARRIEKEIKRFWVQHLGRWVRGYARLIVRLAEHSFYREMARFLGGFAAEELEALELNVEDVDQARLVVPKVDMKVEFDPNEPVCNGCVGEAINQKGGAQTLHDLR